MAKREFTSQRSGETVKRPDRAPLTSVARQKRERIALERQAQFDVQEKKINEWKADPEGAVAEINLWGVEGLMGRYGFSQAEAERFVAQVTPQPATPGLEGDLPVSLQEGAGVAAPTQFRPFNPTEEAERRKTIAGADQAVADAAVATARAERINQRLDIELGFLDAQRVTAEVGAADENLSLQERVRKTVAPGTNIGQTVTRLKQGKDIDNVTFVPEVQQQLDAQVQTLVGIGLFDSAEKASSFVNAVYAKSIINPLLKDAAGIEQTLAYKAYLDAMTRKLDREPAPGEGGVDSAQLSAVRNGLKNIGEALFNAQNLFSQFDGKGILEARAKVIKSTLGLKRESTSAVELTSEHVDRLLNGDPSREAVRADLATIGQELGFDGPIEIIGVEGDKGPDRETVSAMRETELVDRISTARENRNGAIANLRALWNDPVGRQVIANEYGAMAISAGIATQEQIAALRTRPVQSPTSTTTAPTTTNPDLEALLNLGNELKMSAMDLLSDVDPAVRDRIMQNAGFNQE